ncbi:hypothetical protein T484DRAFT_1857901 [Baffinella frigidus]|nr:hypothetical protein T484DRAFT_1857901 [Cryptophyta sp. CCMP2293]
MSTSPPPWGPPELTRADISRHRLTIPGLTFLYITGDIADASLYKDAMQGLIAGMKGDTRMLVVASNNRLYGKTALQSLVALELSLLMTTNTYPEPLFRTHLIKTILGINALHGVCGKWIDTASNVLDDWGLNFAGNCMYLRSNFYTKTTNADGCVSYEVAPITKWTGKKSPGSTTPVNTPLFDYVKLLWPSFSASASADPVKMAAGLDAMQTRANAMHVVETAGLDIVVAAKGGGGLTELSMHNILKAIDTIDTADHFNARTAFSNLSYIGTEELFGYHKEAVAAADAVMIPWLERAMNDARGSAAGSVCV